MAALKESPDPVVRDFAYGAFKAGTTVEELIAKHPVPFIARHGRYTDLSYGVEPGALWAFARDGRLYYAISTPSGSGSGHCFFCTASEAELTDRQRSFERYRFGNCFQAVLGPAAVAREFTRE
ncbi:hypothetical protein [Frigoriglobus tundricola]|uniref:hypothetical protein n=1 Tax=Frigoriglobus tundricola TaxID=2774151 RepID=UPI00148E9937|nr:hypothetical protein [Frigoriglobus tundricola]